MAWLLFRISALIYCDGFVHWKDRFVYSTNILSGLSKHEIKKTERLNYCWLVQANAVSIKLNGERLKQNTANMAGKINT